MGMQRASGFSTGHVRPASILSLCLLQGFLARDFYLFLPEDSGTGLRRRISVRSYVHGLQLLMA